MESSDKCLSQCLSSYYTLVVTLSFSPFTSDNIKTESEALHLNSDQLVKVIDEIHM